MEPFVQNLKDELTRTCRLLASGEILSFTDEENRRLQTEGQTLLERLETMETGFLTVGLIGGTGVGKSTLMNALAGKQIAAAGDRRPYTDRVLIYRHETVQLKSMIGLDRIPRQVITHTGEDIRRVVLCDLPDFDSIVEEHRQEVMRFLEHLDILVWVTSIEKYADGRFYEFLQTVPKAAQNFYFVLNKVDQCFDGGPAAAGYDALERILKTFQEHIQNNGVQEPLLFAVSAKTAVEKASLPPWNQFQYLSREIFQQRDLKAVAAVKAGNLDVEIRQYLSSLQKERQNLEIFERMLDTILEEISERRSEWHDTGRQTIARFIDDHLTQAIVDQQGDISCLTGPGYAIGLLLEAWSHRFNTAGSPVVGFSTEALSQDTAALFKQRVQWPAERLRHQRAYHSLPEPFDKKIHQAVAPEILTDDMTDRFRQVFSFYLSEPKTSCRVFVAGQRLTYGIVFVLFLFAIGGEAAWRGLIETPGWRTGFHLAVSMFHTLFSETGLAALGSLLLIHLFIGLRFFHRFRKRRKKAANKILEAVTAAAGAAWQETLQAMTHRVDGLRKEIHDRIQAALPD